MKIAGVWSGHDCSYYVSENGRPTVHAEYERYIREKEPLGDSVQFMLDEYGEECRDIKYLASCCPEHKLTDHKKSFGKINNIIQNNEGKIFFFGHHLAHAANTFFSSNFDDALILTIDGGGAERNGLVSACTIYQGNSNKIKELKVFPIHEMNIGGVWTRATRYIFKLQSGWPRGHQAGTVMAMAAFGDPERFSDDFYKMLTSDVQMASYKPPEQPIGAYTGNDPIHPYLNKWKETGEDEAQNLFDLAAGLQRATEVFIQQLLENAISRTDSTRLCLAGGVALNSVVVGKIRNWFPQIEDVYVTPVPHDGGLAVGAAQYVWHQVLDNPRIKWEDNFIPYLGVQYEGKDIEETIAEKVEEGLIETKKATDEEVIDLLDQQNIVAVFGGGSESGRRALGNRSILADPRSPEMKDKINEKVKHRQWFRPFAPSILREEVENWFTKDVDSPYMSHVLDFKEEMRDKVPAVVHQNGTARLQTVTKSDNRWYHNFITKWHKKSGVPIVLNTSFNDREPICETPKHALNCFLGTEIDYLYFYEEGLLVSRK